MSMCADPHGALLVAQLWGVHAFRACAAMRLVVGPWESYAHVSFFINTKAGQSMPHGSHAVDVK